MHAGQVTVTANLAGLKRALTLGVADESNVTAIHVVARGQDLDSSTRDWPDVEQESRGTPVAEILTEPLQSSIAGSFLLAATLGDGRVAAAPAGRLLLESDLASLGGVEPETDTGTFYISGKRVGTTVLSARVGKASLTIPVRVPQ
jgi:hypothetical protein